MHSSIIVQELRESRGGRPGLSVLTSLLVSVDVKLYWTMLRHWSQLVNRHPRTLSNTTYLRQVHKQELRSCVKVEVAVLGSRPWYAYGFCGRKATLNQPGCQSSGAVWKSRWPSWAPVPNKPYGFCGRKAPWKKKVQATWSRGQGDAPRQGRSTSGPAGHMGHDTEMEPPHATPTAPWRRSKHTS